MIILNGLLLISVNAVSQTIEQLKKNINPAFWASQTTINSEAFKFIRSASNKLNTYACIYIDYEDYAYNLKLRAENIYTHERNEIIVHSSTTPFNSLIGEVQTYRFQEPASICMSSNKIFVGYYISSAPFYIVKSYDLNLNEILNYNLQNLNIAEAPGVSSWYNNRSFVNIAVNDNNELSIL
ncbi:MAG: hypothetical protein KJS45_04420, partial [Bacteroidetes bacterium]|nr:hypothetical protein [Bacteroidota bacterium]